MEDKVLKAIQEALSRQKTNNVPQIYIQDLQSGNVFGYGTNCHDRLVISEDGRSLHYENLQNGCGSRYGDYRFYYKKPKLETEMDKMHEWDIDHWARNVKNKSMDKFLQENQALKDRWEKLKEWCEENCYYVEECCGDIESEDYEEYVYRYINIAQLFEKLQELEQGEDNAKD